VLSLAAHARSTRRQRVLQVHRSCHRHATTAHDPPSTARRVMTIYQKKLITSICLER